MSVKQWMSAIALFASANVLAVPSTQFTVSGAVANRQTYALADLQALPSETQTVDYTAGGVPQTRTYSGTRLWGVLDRAGILTDPVPRNDVLNRFVLATATDGYRVVLSLGELNPRFGNRPDLVAYSEVVGGVPTGLGADGFARITAPGDVRGGRYLSNLVDLDVQASASTQAGTGGGRSTSFGVSGAVAAPRDFDLAALQALPSLTRTVNGIAYTGVSLWTLLTSSVGIPVDPAINNDILGKYVVATGSDGYKSVFSLGELNPFFGNQPDFIAYAADGVPLAGNGFARIVVPNDLAAGRWVSNLVALEVFTPRAIPEPGTLALLVGGLALIGAARRRR